MWTMWGIYRMIYNTNKQTNKQIINNKYRLCGSSLISAGLAHATAIIIHQQQQVETSVPQFCYLETV